MRRKGRLSGVIPFLRPPRVLIVGADTAEFDSMRLCLWAQGFHPVFATAIGAASVARRERPNALVLEFRGDARLTAHVMDAIREIPDLERMPAIAITPAAWPAEPLRRAGFDLVVERPLGPQTLAAALLHALFGHRFTQPAIEQSWG